MPSKLPAAEGPDKFVINTSPVLALDHFTTEGLTPAKVRDIIRFAEAAGEVGPLYRLYERMLRTDTRYGGLVGQTKRAVSGVPLKVIPARTTNAADKAIAEDYAAMAELMLSSELDEQQATKDFADPHYIGAKLYKLRWEMQDLPYGRRVNLPREIAPVEGQYLAMEIEDGKPGARSRKGEMKVYTKRKPEGEYVADLPAGSAMFLEAEYGNDRYPTLGIARTCLPWYLGLQFVNSWWLQYIEGYASPLRIGRYHRGADPKARMDMERFLRVLGQHGYALFPNDMEVQLLEANRQGTVTTYQDFINKGHEEYAVAILGQADTPGTSTKGSYARTTVSNEIRYEVLQDIARLVKKGWTKIMRMVVAFNYGPAARFDLLPTVQPILITPAESTAKASVAEKAQQNGVPVPVDYWYEQIIGVSAPREGQEAVVNGQVYIFGVDPTPKPKEEKVAEQNRKAQEKANQEREKAQQGDRSVANPNSGEQGAE